MHKYIEIISGIKLKVIGHAPGLAFLSVAILRLFRHLVRVFSGVRNMAPFRPLFVILVIE